MPPWFTREVASEFTAGKPVLIFDSAAREEETDMVYYAGSVSEESIYRLRAEAGGLICYATTMEVSRRLDLPILRDVLRGHKICKPLMDKKPRYGDASTFSLWINHVNVKTGISDRDRALTIRELHKVVSLICEGRLDEGRQLFISGFYFPGHIPILISKGLRHRMGHTELSVSLALIVGLRPSMVFAEMLDKGISMSLEKAERYAKERGLRLIRGDEIIEYAEKEDFDL